MIDETSMKILKILQEKARIPNVEVSRQIGLAPSAILERIRKMEKQGIIDGYEVRLNPERFCGSQIAFVHVGVDVSLDAECNVGRQLAEIEEIQEVHYIAGDDGYLIKVRTRDTRQLGQLLRQKVLAISGVTTTRTATVLDTHKETAKIPIKREQGV